jgi:MFS family permease
MRLGSPDTPSAGLRGGGPAHAGPRSPRRSARQSARSDFLKLWVGQTISLIGSQVTLLALPLTAIEDLHASTLELGWLGTVQWLPFVILALPVGVWGDRRTRRPLLIASDALRALLVIAIVALAAAGALTLVLLLAAALGLGACAVVFEVSYTSYLPGLVGRDVLVAANSRLQASASVAQVGGPGLGGLLVQLLTAPTALIADAASFLLSAISLTAIRQAEPEPQPERDPAPVVTQIRAGLRFTLKQPILRALVGTSAIYNLFDQWIFVLFTPFAIHDLGFTAATIGLVLSAGAIGAVLGSLVTATVTARVGVGGAMVLSVAVECIAMLLVPLAPRSRAVAVAVLICAYALNGSGTALSTIIAVSVRQTITPAGLLGRVNGTYRFISYGLIALGALLGGLAGHLFGLRGGLALGAVGLLATIAWVMVSPLRTLGGAARRRPDGSSSQTEPA